MFDWRRLILVFSSNELDFLILQNGKDGVPADSKYTWVKYSQNADGSNLTDNPTGAIYIGIAYNMESQEESNDPSDYAWTKIKGETGDTGADAYTVILGNENITFSVGYDANTAISNQSYSSTIQVMQGANQRNDFTVGEVKSAYGITVAKEDETIVLSVQEGDTIAADSGYFRIPINIDGLVFYKDLTWSVAKQGQPGNPGQSGQPAINIVLGNENQNIPCNNEGYTLESFLVEIPFSAYQGFDRIQCSASVGVLPSGITLGSNTASTVDEDGLVILNVARNADLGGKDVLQGKVIITFTVSATEISKQFTWTKTRDGADGTDGGEGSFTLYDIESSTPVLSKTFENEFSPSSVTFTAYVSRGNSSDSDREEYEGMFTVEESTNGTTYSTKYLSSENESSVTYTPSSTDVLSIRCTLYKADGITNSLDVYTIPVFTDIDNIRPVIEEITNTMTGLESTVDSVEQSITNKIWQSDITTQINNYDNTTVKIIRDQITEQEETLEGVQTTVSDVQSTLTTKADGSTVQELSEKVSQVEQNVDEFKVTVEDNYTTNEDLSNTAQTLRSEFSQTASEINQSVTDLEGNISTITQNMSSIEDRVEDAEGNITSLEQTATQITQDVTDVKGNMTSVTQDVEAINQRVTNVEGDVSDFQQTAENLQTQITNNAGDISRLEQDAEGFKTTVSNTYSTKSETIKNQTEEFYLSNSPTVLSGGSWSASQPVWTPGKYIWRRTKVTYGDNTTEYTPSENGVCLTGNSGEDGGTGLALVIFSSNGSFFKNTGISTILTAHVYQDGVEVAEDDIGDIGTIRWYKNGSSTPVATGVTLSVSDDADSLNYIAQLEG